MREIDREAALDSARDELKKHWEEEWRRWITSRAIEQVETEVSPTTFEIFRLLTFEELVPRDVAARLGVELTQVYNAKSRVMKKIMELRLEFDQA